MEDDENNIKNIESDDEMLELIDEAAAPIAPRRRNYKSRKAQKKAPLPDTEEQPPEQKEKKRPGRPRKKVVDVPFEVKGIVNEPHQPDNVLEMVYQNPRVLKKLFALYSSYAVNELTIGFRHDAIEIITHDHSGQNDIYLKIFADCLSHYYCKEPVNIGIKREVLECIFKALDKSHKITFVLNSSNNRSILHLLVRDYEIDTNDHHEIDLTLKNNEAAGPRQDDADYPIKFMLSGKYLKKRVNDISKMTSRFSFQKHGDGPLQITYDKTRQVKLNSYFLNPNKIKLQCNIEDPDDLFSTTIDISNIKPFTNSNIGEQVWVSLDKYKKICFTTEIDHVKIERDGEIRELPVCQLKVFSEIVRLGDVLGLEDVINDRIAH